MKTLIASMVVAFALAAGGCGSNGGDSTSGHTVTHGCQLFRQVATDYTKHGLRGHDLVSRMKQVEAALPEGADVHTAVAATVLALRRHQDKNTAAGIKWISEDCAKIDQ